MAAYWTLAASIEMITENTDAKQKMTVGVTAESKLSLFPVSTKTYVIISSNWKKFERIS